MADDKTSEKVEMGNSSGDYYPCDLLFHPIQLDFPQQQWYKKRLSHD
ncbi:hypothetical protein AAK943_08245 [Emergencia timonensis]|nr:hypothetical protein [Emergencia timonensis]